MKILFLFVQVSTAYGLFELKHIIQLRLLIKRNCKITFKRGHQSAGCGKGLPDKPAYILDMARWSIFLRVKRVALPTCGVRISFSLTRALSEIRGWPLGSGSGSNTCAWVRRAWVRVQLIQYERSEVRYMIWNKKKRKFISLISKMLEVSTAVKRLVQHGIYYVKSGRANLSFFEGADETWLVHHLRQW